MRKPYKPGPNKLPLTPWWYHPNHRYEGKHRGQFKYWPSEGSVFSFGVRDVMVRPYVFGEGDALVICPENAGFHPIGFLPNDPELDPIPGDDKVIRTYAKREVRIEIP